MLTVCHNQYVVDPDAHGSGTLWEPAFESASATNKNQSATNKNQDPDPHQRDTDPQHWPL
jgi:hypothetical protein